MSAPLSPRLGLVFLIVITLIWGSTFVVVKETLATLSPALLLALRFSVAALLLVWVPLPRSVWRAGLILGGLSFVGFATQTVGMTMTTASKAAFITGFSVVLTPLVSALWFRLRVPARAYLAALTALAGLGLMTLTGPVGVSAGDFWVLATALAYALYIVYTGEVAQRHGALALSAAQLWPMAALAWVWAWPQVGELQEVTFGAGLSVVYLAAIATALVAVMQIAAQRVVAAHVAALVFVLEPVFAAGFAYLLLGESLGLWGWVGGALVGAAMLLSELKLGKGRTPAHATDAALVPHQKRG
jgi:drug/metabolite transporter (DMT)-like permease